MRISFLFNVAAAAGAFIIRDRQLVLCVRGKDPGIGQLDVPGGFIEFDESLEEGLRREILEELGIEVGELSYLASAPNDYRFAGVPYKTSDVFLERQRLLTGYWSPRTMSRPISCSIPCASIPRDLPLNQRGKPISSSFQACERKVGPRPDSRKQSQTRRKERVNGASASSSSVSRS